MMERRAVLRALSAGVIGSVSGARAGFSAEPPPETARVRLNRYPFDVACVAPQWVAEELLRAEGFKTVEYVSIKGDADLMAAGRIDLMFLDAPD
jgi:NitT/TauT family transport system substrate-binding protein